MYYDALCFVMGFWYPLLALGFQVPADQIFAQQQGSIFYIKSLVGHVSYPKPYLCLPGSTEHYQVFQILQLGLVNPELIMSPSSV